MSAEQTALFSRVARSALERSAVNQLRVAGTEETLDDQLEKMIARYIELGPLVRERQELRKRIKECMADESVMKAGRFTVHATTLSVNEKQVRSYSAVRLSIQ